MPLHYVIDAYNIINHTTFARSNKIRDPLRALLEFVKTRRYGKRLKNKVTLVFDGYPKVSAQGLEEAGIDVIYSREETADTRIKRLVETSKNPKGIAVVSDDRQIQFFIKSAGASAISVEGFVNPRPKNISMKKEDSIKPDLNYTQIDAINQELKGLWLNKKQ